MPPPEEQPPEVQEKNQQVADKIAAWLVSPDAVPPPELLAVMKSFPQKLTFVTGNLISNRLVQLQNVVTKLKTIEDKLLDETALDQMSKIDLARLHGVMSRSLEAFLQVTRRFTVEQSKYLTADSSPEREELIARISSLPPDTIRKVSEMLSKALEEIK